MKFPIYDTDETILLSSGMQAQPLILYPGKKLEYSEPAIDMLVELENQLRHIESNICVTVNANFSSRGLLSPLMELYIANLIIPSGFVWY